MKQERSEKLLLLDGHSILNRAFFGLPDLTNGAGLHTNAVYGFLNIMFRFLEEEKPQYITVAFDEHAPTFRHKMYEAYKGTRKPMAEELRQQVPMMKEMLRAMGVTVVSQAGLEADDLLGTMARRAEESGMEVIIVSGDRDLLQLATDHTRISIPKTKKTGTEVEHYYAADVVERYQVTPSEFIDVKALMGDTSDNIPGVPSIGEKTATAIIAQYHCIEEAYAHADEIKPPRASKNLKEYYDQAVLSKTLATIEVRADISYSPQEAALGDLFTPEAYELCKAWEFKNFLGRFHVTAPVEEEENFSTVTKQSDLVAFVDKICARADDDAKEEHRWIGLYLCFSQPPLGQDHYKVYGMALSHGEESIWAPLREDSDLAEEALKEQIRRLAESGLRIATTTAKEMIKICAPDPKDRPFDYVNTFDVAVAEYLLHPLSKTYLAEDMAGTYLQRTLPGYAEVFGKQALAESALDDTKAMEGYACSQAQVCACLPNILIQELKSADMMSLYEVIELPLVFTLADMECEGIAIDGAALKEYADKLSVRIRELEQRIYDQAGEEFNINSPKQLGVILFDKLGMPNGKKTKTGYSTAADVLEALAVDYPIVEDILEYRQLAKLKSTYAEGLAHCIGADGRIRSSFQQTVTATGRISSTEPNLQNIPVRMEMGKMIRKVFHPKEGFIFLDADYSQIELRVLSHMSEDENLIQAFLQGQDIHRSTASRVFHTPFDEVTPLQRRNAKAVNFGIVYGISAFGLGQDLGIGRKEAQQYIDDYFLAYPKMKEFLDGLVEQGKKEGCVRTMYGRIRPIPELSSGNFAQRQFGERVAMNSPIQGTAADIIKIAMVRVHDRLQAEGLESKLLLQVHDELLIEAKEGELEQVKAILLEEMQSASELAVPLEVDMHTGMDWYAAK